MRGSAQSILWLLIDGLRHRLVMRIYGPIRRLLEVLKGARMQSAKLLKGGHWREAWVDLHGVLLHSAAALALIDLHSTVELSRRGGFRGCELKGSLSQS